MKRLLPLLALLLCGCASIGSREVSVTCGVSVTAYLIALHNPWAIVPGIYAWAEATGKVKTDAGSAVVTCGGAASAAL